MEPPEIDKQGRLFQTKVDVELAGTSLIMIREVKTLRVQQTGKCKWRGALGIYYRRHLQMQP